jgi:hypothetical protein
MTKLKAHNAGLFDERLYGKASEMVPAWVEVIAGGIGGSSFRI